MKELLKDIPLVSKEEGGLTFVYDTQYTPKWVVGYTDAPSWFSSERIGEGETIEQAVEGFKRKINL